MKKLALVASTAAALALVATLAACSTDATYSSGSTSTPTTSEVPIAEATPVVTPTTPAAPLVTGADAQDATFDAAVSSGLGMSDPKVADAAEDVAHAFCNLLEGGTDFTTAASLTLKLAQNQGVTATQVGVVIGAGVPVYCPAYNADLQAFIAAN